MKNALLCALLLTVTGCISWDEELATYCANGGGGCPDAGGGELGDPALEILGGSGQSAPEGRSFETELSVRAVDEGGAPVAGVVVLATCPEAQPTCSFEGSPTATAITDGDGVAVLNAPSAGSPGSYTLTLSAAGYGTAAVALENLSPVAETIQPEGAPATSTGVVQSFPNPFEFSVLGSDGEPLAGATVRFTLSGGDDGPTFLDSSGPTIDRETGDTGLALTGVISAGTAAGEYVLTAEVLDTDGSVAAATTVDLEVLPGAAVQVVLLSPEVLTTAAGRKVQEAPRVQAQDTYGNPVPNVEVIFENGATGAHCLFTEGLPEAAVLTNADGEATEVCSTQAAGTFTVTARLAGTLSSVQFTVEALTPDAIKPEGGTSQTSPSGTPFPLPITVKIVTLTVQEVPNALVTFSATNALFEGGLAVMQVETDVNGRATTPLLTPQAPGPVTVTVTVAVLVPPEPSEVYTLTSQ